MSVTVIARETGFPSLAFVRGPSAPSGVYVPKPDERPDSIVSTDEALPLSLYWVFVEQDVRRVGNDAALTTQVRMAGMVNTNAVSR